MKRLSSSPNPWARTGAGWETASKAAARSTVAAPRAVPDRIAVICMAAFKQDVYRRDGLLVVLGRGCLRILALDLSNLALLARRPGSAPCRRYTSAVRHGGGARQMAWAGRLELSELPTLIIGIVALLLGRYVRRGVPLLKRIDIPDAVIGATIVAVLCLLADLLMGLEIRFGAKTRDILLLIFF